ncbi:MAG: hypothetical protein LQ348_000135 [Seirophora lacunosa]|nr:MAG: hypothetical protein LQ348_000135 [Seirophora lacunosa]
MPASVTNGVHIGTARSEDDGPPARKPEMQQTMPPHFSPSSSSAPSPFTLSSHFPIPFPHPTTSNPSRSSASEPAAPSSPSLKRPSSPSRKAARTPPLSAPTSSSPTARTPPLPSSSPPYSPPSPTVPLWHALFLTAKQQHQQGGPWSRPREALIELFFADEGKRVVYADKRNENCPVRVYLEERSSSGSAGSTEDTLRKCPIRVDMWEAFGWRDMIMMTMMGLTRSMALGLAVVHWGAGIDGIGQRTSSCSSPSPPSNIDDHTSSCIRNATHPRVVPLTPTTIVQAPECTSSTFDEARTIAFSAHGVRSKLVPASLGNDPAASSSSSSFPSQEEHVAAFVTIITIIIIIIINNNNNNNNRCRGGKRKGRARGSNRAQEPRRAALEGVFRDVPSGQQGSAERTE